jgi:hypothetical protein
LAVVVAEECAKVPMEMESLVAEVEAEELFKDGQALLIL